MPDIPNIRVVTLATAIGQTELIFADDEKRSHPFVAINRDIHGERELELPNAFFERLPDGFTGDLLFALTTEVELRQAGHGLGRHREPFLAGEPVMFVVNKIHETPGRAQGGQDVAGLEERARDGLYVTVALATERMRACADCRERKKMAVDTRRGEIFLTLEPALSGLSAINLFREGQKLAARWHPGMSSHQALKSAYDSVADLPGARAGRVDFAAIERNQIDLVRTAGAVYAKTLAFLKVQHESSAMMREMMETDEYKNAIPAEKHTMQARFLREEAPAHHQEMAHDKQGGPTRAQLIRAACAMDLNPAPVFLNVRTYELELECAMLLGRAERGIGVMLTADRIRRLKRFMALAEAPDGSDAASDNDVEVARCMRDIALRVKPQAG